VRNESSSARERAESLFKRKEQQRVEGEVAYDEYKAKRAAIQERTARLRALRLAREAAMPAPAGKSGERAGARRTLRPSRAATGTRL